MTIRESSHCGQAPAPSKGNQTRIVVADLETPLTVRFDGQAATCSELSDYELECITPPGMNAGLVDVAIDDSSGSTLNLEQAYRYIDLGDLTLNPEDGAVAGNTALRLSGPNLAQTIEGAQVTLKFDGLSAMQIEAPQMWALILEHLDLPLKVRVLSRLSLTVILLRLL